MLAHPLRARLLGEAAVERPVDRDRAGCHLDTNTGATSYHLRKLASVGLVEETGEGRGRERWWRPTTQMHEWNDDVTEGDPDATASAGWLREHYVRSFVEAADRWLSNHDAWPIEWRRLAGSSDFTMALTTAELDSLMNELWAVVMRVDAESTAAAAEEAAGRRGADELRPNPATSSHGNASPSTCTASPKVSDPDEPRRPCRQVALPPPARPALAAGGLPDPDHACCCRCRAGCR